MFFFNIKYNFITITRSIKNVQYF